MAGYRPDDDWAATNESDKPTSAYFKFVAALGLIVVAAIVIGNLAHPPLWLFLGIALAVPSFFLCLLIYCLRMGVVAVRGGDVDRDDHPIAYWIGIATLALAASFSLYFVWNLVS